MLLLLVTTCFAGAICTDGWVSASTGAGTCSHHGGVATWTASNRQSISEAALGRASDMGGGGIFSGATTTLGASPEPLDVTYIEERLKPLPKSGRIGVVVAEGSDCVVGIYGQASFDDASSYGSQRGYHPGYWLAELDIGYDLCSTVMNPGDVFELLSERVILPNLTTFSAKVRTLSHPTRIQNAPSWATHW